MFANEEFADTAIRGLKAKYPGISKKENLRRHPSSGLFTLSFFDTERLRLKLEQYRNITLSPGIEPPCITSLPSGKCLLFCGGQRGTKWLSASKQKKQLHLLCLPVKDFPPSWIFKILLPEKIYKVKDLTILSQIMVELTLSVKLNDEDCTITLCSKMLSPCLSFPPILQTWSVWAAWWGLQNLFSCE